MALLAFQRPAVAAVINHFRDRSKSVDWNGIKIHPPIVVNASVSSGKSLMICELATAVHAAGAARNNVVKVLVLQRQGELAEQNSEAAWGIGLKNSTYSASLNAKSTFYDVVYGTEGTVARALETSFGPGGFHPDIVLLDECHQCPYEQADSQMMKILTHCYVMKPKLRVAGFSGSTFRNIESIIGTYWASFACIEPGDDLYPEGGVGNGIISTEFMLENGWVVPPQFGWPAHDEDGYDFSGVDPRSGSWEFSEAELDERTSDFNKLMGICAEVVERSKDRLGVLIFAATQRHTGQVAKALSMLGVAANDIGVIIDSTPDAERADILKRAKAGQCKYVINVGVLTTGVNVPQWDTVVFLRPIGSLVLLIQAIGRVLRLLFSEDAPGIIERDSMTVDERHALIAASDKPFALVLDYAGVMDRLGHLYENPILEQAEKEHAKSKNEIIHCPDCNEENSIHARRCIGQVNGARCEFFWSFNSCPECGTKNDVVARECRQCKHLLIDPNASLIGKHYTDAELTPVNSMKMSAKANGLLVVSYELADGRKPVQFFHPNSGNNIAVNNRIWYGNFVKYHVHGSVWQNKARHMKAAAIEKMAAMFNQPTHISARENKGKWTIGRRVFRDTGAVVCSDEIVEGADA